MQTVIKRRIRATPWGGGKKEKESEKANESAARGTKASLTTFVNSNGWGEAKGKQGDERRKNNKKIRREWNTFTYTIICHIEYTCIFVAVAAAAAARSVHFATFTFVLCVL